MVTSSVWHDINQDGWIDLIVAGELMPITILENQKGKLVDKTEAYHLAKSHGMWSKILLEDMDNDGDMDLIAGNAGLNSQLKANEQEPLTVTYADFDQNETIDPMICYYIQGKSYPMASLDETAMQMPWIRKKFLKYHDYAQAGLSDLFTSEQLDKAQSKTVFTLATTYFENTGKGIFKAQVLTSVAQTSWVSGISCGDFNKDGKKIFCYLATSILGVFSLEKWTPLMGYCYLGMAKELLRQVSLNIQVCFLREIFEICNPF
jgi:hypothetical protein